MHIQAAKTVKQRRMNRCDKAKGDEDKAERHGDGREVLGNIINLAR